MKTADFINKLPKSIPTPVEQPVVEQELTFPEFTMESAEQQFAESLNEDATAGATGSPSVAVSFAQEGTFPKEVIKRQKTYTNTLTKGGPVKIKKAQ